MYEDNSTDGGGHAMAFGSCLACKRTFGFNPHKVPSLTVDGTRRPVCSLCMDLVNKTRMNKGLPPHPISPGAYDPIPIEEL